MIFCLETLDNPPGKDSAVVWRRFNPVASRMGQGFSQRGHVIPVRDDGDSFARDTQSYLHPGIPLLD